MWLDVQRQGDVCGAAFALPHVQARAGGAGGEWHGSEPADSGSDRGAAEQPGASGRGRRRRSQPKYAGQRREIAFRRRPSRAPVHEDRALCRRGRDCSRRHGRDSARRGLRHSPRDRRQIPARSKQSHEKTSLCRGSPDHGAARASEHRAHSRAGRGCPQSPVLLDEDGQGPKPGPAPARAEAEPERDGKGISTGAPAEYLRQHLQRHGLRALAQRRAPGPEARQRDGRRLRRGLRHGLGPGQGPERQGGGGRGGAHGHPRHRPPDRRGGGHSRRREHHHHHHAVQQAGPEPGDGGRPHSGRHCHGDARVHASRASQRQAPCGRSAQRHLLARSHPVRDDHPPPAGEPGRRLHGGADARHGRTHPRAGATQPGAARAGKIPRELSAVVLKALAAAPESATPPSKLSAATSSATSKAAPSAPSTTRCASWPGR